MTNEADNPRAIAGANEPPLQDRLALTYMEQLATAEQIAIRANAAPKSIEDEEQHTALAQIVKDARATAKALESHRVSEKAPYLDASRTVDGFFNQIIERMNKVVAGMEKRIKAHLDAKAAAERARIAEEARIKREQEDAARREAQARLDEAARARANADVHETKMVEAAAATATAAAHASEAREAERTVETAKPADLARTRTDAGLSTLQRFWNFEIVDPDAISLVKLRPFIKAEHIEQAVRAFVKLHGGSQELPGVYIFEDTKASVR